MVNMPERASAAANRLLTLDYLRGYFVLVIIIDHLNRFPSLWAAITGTGRLWVTAAEGFVMISGLLVGYVRGRKGMKLPFSTIARKLLGRSLLLYTWTIIMTVVYAAITWYSDISPLPWFDSPTGDWQYMWHRAITLEMPHLWIHFLALYAIFLFLAIGAVWLLRNGYDRLLAVLSVLIYIYGFGHNSEWMQWQILFFIPAIAGFYLDHIRTAWQSWSAHVRHWLEATTLAIGALLLATSMIYIFFPQLVPYPSEINGIFSAAPFTPARVLLTGVWFCALVMLFDRLTPYLARYSFGIIEYFGTHSLTAYIIHGLVLCGTTLFFARSDGWIVNTLLALGVILVVFLLIRTPVVKRLIPR
jgi:hypothetical protein